MDQRFQHARAEEHSCSGAGWTGRFRKLIVPWAQIFHEITVAIEGYEFDVEVAYEWMPDFCSHCQNLGHYVSACRWLDPRKDSNANNEKIAQGKKHVPVKKTYLGSYQGKSFRHRLLSCLHTTPTRGRHGSSCSAATN